MPRSRPFLKYDLAQDNPAAMNATSNPPSKTRISMADLPPKPFAGHRYMQPH
jgi:hypothetical protein